ncbi:MAG: hypothetical protein VYE77_09475 [Planctomycetota bacterium]|nr:hypothetical protein [Planctomycetota bacterium]
MPRWSLAIACVGLTACAAGDHKDGEAFGEAGPTLLTAPSVEWQLQAVPRATEARLRSRLVTDADPTDVALELVWLLDRSERHAQALAVLDAALRRVPDAPALLAARAGVLRDLGQRHEAVAVLVSLREREGVEALHPGLLVELVELQVMEGLRQAGQQTLAGLRAHHADHEWVLDRGAELVALEVALQASRPDQIRVRDLLGNLRGCPDPAERLLALDALLQVGGEARVRAEAVALDDSDPRVRARAVAQAQIPIEVLAEFCAVALSDPAVAVRVAGAGRATALPAVQAAALLVRAMAVEDSPEVFCALDAVLRRMAGTGNQLSVDAAGDPVQRAAVLAEWRKQWAM